MAGADSVIRLIAAVLLIFVMIVVGWVGVTLLDPVFANVIDTSLLSSLGWGSPQEVVYLFFGLALFALLFVVIFWLWLSPIRSDVRQEQRPPGPF